MSQGIDIKDDLKKWYFDKEAFDRHDQVFLQALEKAGVIVPAETAPDEPAREVPEGVFPLVQKAPELAKVQPCGCVICTCADQYACHGCGAKHCGTHPFGTIPNPVYLMGGLSTVMRGDGS